MKVDIIITYVYMLCHVLVCSIDDFCLLHIQSNTTKFHLVVQ